MSEDKKDDIFALVKENGLPAYPKWVGDVIVKNPEEHKKELAKTAAPEVKEVQPEPKKNETKVPDWGKK